VLKMQEYLGADIHKLAKELWPLNRSLTGVGVRQTLELLQSQLPDLKIHSIPTGTKVFDWVIPQEWNVREAYIIDPCGKKLCDFNENNLHLVGYSVPFKGTLSLAELCEHIHTMPDQSDAIPYVTSYYAPNWGFCMSYDEFEKLKQGDYYVVIDSCLSDGVLNYGEIIISGATKSEVLLSTYICHPSMANNEISGISVTTYLAEWLSSLEANQYTYRILFIPETLGSICYLSFHKDYLIENVKAGFNISCVGDDRAHSYLPSRNGNTLSDKAAKHVLRWYAGDFVKYSWLNRGSDERQYCAPGIDLPIASMMRTKYGKYPEYHTSLDDLVNVVTPDGLNGGYWALRLAIGVLEKNYNYKTLVFCEPQMGKRGLYATLSKTGTSKSSKLFMDFLSYCDGTLDLISISDALGVPAWELYDVIAILEDHQLIKAL
jgi:aminopeptidase-like protein